MRRSAIHLCKSTLRYPLTIEHQEDLNNDLTRTYPEMSWFNDHLNSLSIILRAFAYANPNIGYAQGMNFLTFILYYVYYEDCPKYAIKDTFYSLHNIVKHIRPIIPKGSDDKDI